MLNGVGGKLFALEGNEVTTGVSMPVAVARPVADAIELGWETVAFRAGTTFNVYRRELGDEDREAGERRFVAAAKAAIAATGKPAREQKAEVQALTAQDPFVRLNPRPIVPAGGYQLFRDGTAEPGAGYEYRVGYTPPNSPVERFLAPVEAALAAPRAVLGLGVPIPQPAQGPVTLALDLAREGAAATAAVYAVDGRPVRNLGRELPPGRHLLTWDGRLESGERAPAGIYLVRVAARGSTATRKVVLVP